MIQGGDRLGSGGGGPGYKFGGEKGTLKHDGPGVLAYANSGANTDGSQFYITEVATPHLDADYSVFGKVSVGVEIVSEITGVDRDANDKPLVPVMLKKVEIFRSKTVPTN